jgi:ketopantoate reductase
MSTLIVGAGAAGGYFRAQLIAAGRAVAFLVHPQTQARLGAEGLRIRRGTNIETTAVAESVWGGAQVGRAAFR